MSHDEIGKRMKDYYEHPYRFCFPKKSNILIRIDGKAFHNYTRGMQKPFDNILISAMQETMLYLCEEIQNAKFGYTQSDEITIVMHDKDSVKTDPWFGNNKSKIESVSASFATAKFNQIMYEKVNKLAYFDSRAFLIPENYEVFNNLLWRQLDAIRNSISMVAQYYFSHRQLMNKNTKEMQEMIFQEKGINWSNLEDHLKRGSICYRDENRKWKIEGAFDFRDFDLLNGILFCYQKM